MNKIKLQLALWLLESVNRKKLPYPNTFGVTINDLMAQFDEKNVRI